MVSFLNDPKNLRKREKSSSVVRPDIFTGLNSPLLSTAFSVSGLTL